MKISAYLTTGFLLACVYSNAYALDEGTCQPQETWNKIETTHEVYANQANLALELDINTIVLGKPFSFKVKHCDDKGVNQSVKPDRITADAIMPAHQHGMNYTAKIS